MTNTFQIVQITCANEEEAGRIGRALVEQRLAACANIIPDVRSFYVWNGELQDDREAICLVKTRMMLVERLVQAVKELHSYSVPAIVAVDINGGDEDYIDWLNRELPSDQPLEASDGT